MEDWAEIWAQEKPEIKTTDLFRNERLSCFESNPRTGILFSFIPINKLGPPRFRWPMIFAGITGVMAKKVVDTTESALEVLRRAHVQGLPPCLGPDNPELSICVALVESGHLDGWVTIEGSCVCAILDARITPTGVEFLEQFEGIIKNSPWKTALRPGWVLAGMALFLSVIIFLVSACQGESNLGLIEFSSETSRQSDDPSVPRIFGVCGLPPVE